MSRWKIVPAATDIIEREKDYTASFDAHNIDTGATVNIEFTQAKGGPVADLIEALRATAQRLLIAATGDDIDTTKRAKLN